MKDKTNVEKDTLAKNDMTALNSQPSPINTNKDVEDNTKTHFPTINITPRDDIPDNILTPNKPSNDTKITPNIIPIIIRVRHKIHLGSAL